MFKHNRHRKPRPDELQMSEKRIHFLMERYRRLFGSIIHSRYLQQKDLNDDDHKFIKFYLDKKNEYKERRIHIIQQEEIDKSIDFGKQMFN